MSHSNVEHPTLADAIRVLAMDAVQQANSGHPGAPMGLAEIAQALWLGGPNSANPGQTKQGGQQEGGHLRHNPADPAWFDRDRFVLSNGHASMLLYAVLHLTGYDLPLEEIKRFRQLHSRTPGHPEVGITPGVEATTGPLGQGFGNAVGMALAEALLAAEFNRDGHTIVDHYTYAIVGDGCLMEGISHEVGSLAGTLKLSKLIVLYDDNGISIDGKVGPWFADDTAKRFTAYGWNVISPVDGQSVAAVDAALRQARDHAVTRQGRGGPTLIICRTVIGKGAPTLGGTEKVHGAPLGKEEVAATRRALNWPDDEPFNIPPKFYEDWNTREWGAALQQAWQSRFEAYQAEFPQEAKEFRRRMRGDLPHDFVAKTQALLYDQVKQAEENGAKPMATRRTSQEAIKALVQILPELLGGSADLTGSNNTDWPDAVAINTPINPKDSPINPQDSASLKGRYLHYGVREFGMSAIMNGMALHGGYLPFGGTFLTFSDYARNALRMAALMKQRVVGVFTHDSIGLGEDGPTHQSIEHANSLRLIPNLSVWRPCDITETFVAWIAAVQRPASLGMAVCDEGGPTVLLLSRQNLPFVPRDAQTMDAIARGGYVLRDGFSETQAKAVIIATGSEVSLALAAQEQLAKEDIPVRVVSMPSTSVFDQQNEAWRSSVLPPNIPRVAVEAGSTGLWHQYVGLEGKVVGIDRYGESAPASDLFSYLSLTAEHVVKAVKQVLNEGEKHDHTRCN